MRKQVIPTMLKLEHDIDNDGNVYVLVKDHGYQVVSWSPGKSAEKLPCTQVHFLLQLPIDGAKAVLRMKSVRAIDELIGVLIQHRNDVWPNGGAA